jgi:outer membrane protein assembly factor BamB
MSVMVRGGRGRSGSVGLRRAAWACLIVIAVMAVNPQDVLLTVQASGPSGNADVLFFFTPEDYDWGNSAVNGSLDAVTVSRNAASFMNKGFVYETNASGTYIEIGGLAPTAGSWNWTLLKWSASAGWAEWKSPAGSLLIGPGDAIAWCPGNELTPAPDPLTRYPWPMFKSNAARTGGSLSPVLAGNQTFWTRQLEAPVLSSPCAASGKLFVVAGGSGGGQATITALNVTDGSVAWQRQLGASGPQLSSPAYSGGLIFVGLSTGILKAFDARSGEPAWEYSSPAGQYGITSSPAIVNGDVLFAGGDGMVRRLDRHGALVWQAQLNATSGSASSLAAWMDRAGKGPSDRLVLATAGGGLACLNFSDGVALWSIGLGLDFGTGLVAGTPAISQFGHTFVPVINRDASGAWKSMNLYGINLEDSIIQWNSSYGASSSSPACQEDGLFLGTGTELTGHHPTRGTRFWGIPLAPVDGSPAVSRGYIYFALNATNGTVGCARVGGLLEWTRELGTPFRSSPVLADGRLFICGMDGRVFCIGRAPRPLLAASLLEPPSPISAGATIELKAVFNNSGEAPAAFLAYLTVDGNRTAVRKGPIEVHPGETKTAVFEWKAEEGAHELNLSLDGAVGAINGTSVEVKAASGACASVVAIVPVLGFATAIPMIVAFTKKKGGGMR